MLPTKKTLFRINTGLGVAHDVWKRQLKTQVCHGYSQTVKLLMPLCWW